MVFYSLYIIKFDNVYISKWTKETGCIYYIVCINFINTSSFVFNNELGEIDNDKSKSN